MVSPKHTCITSNFYAKMRNTLWRSGIGGRVVKIDFSVSKHHSTKFLQEELVKMFPGSILVIDSAGIVVCAQTTLDITGVKASDLIDSSIEDLIQKGVLQNSPSLRTLKSKKVEVDSNFWGGDNTRPIATISVPVLKEEDGSIQYVFAYTLEERLAYDLLQKIGEERERNDRIIQLFNRAIGKTKVITANPQIRELLALLRRVAGSDSVIALHGETGCGKEVFARFAHEHSLRKDKIFIPVNCAAIPQELIESELFGYESGAFTGARREGAAGLFELASEGTLFLDEIGELPLQMQSKLLRVLESGEYSKVGGKRVLKSNARVIVATNRNLKEMVSKNEFRADLYYRIHVIAIDIPPLRERKEDIRPLVNFFLQRLNQKYNSCKVVGENLIEMLECYDWPGNIRELRNVVERTFITCSGNILSFEGNFPEISLQTAAPVPNINHKEEKYSTLRESLFRYEQELIAQAIQRNQGNMTKTAKELGISRACLYKKAGRGKEMNE